MDTKFSILSVPIRPEIRESLTVGMLMMGEGKVLFRYSDDKIRILKGLISQPAHKLVVAVLKSIKSAVNKADKRDLFDPSNIDTGKILTYSYLQYLSTYNNNLVTISPPKDISLPFTPELFKELFFKFIDNKTSEPRIEKPNPTFNKMRKTFFPKLKGHFNIQEEVDSTLIPGLLLPVKIDLIGKNEETVFVQAVDFERNISLIESDFGKIMIFREAIKSCKGFLLSQEPDKSNIKPHQAWNGIRKSSLFEYVDLSDKEKIREYAEQHGVVPFKQ